MELDNKITYIKTYAALKELTNQQKHIVALNTAIAEINDDASIISIAEEINTMEVFDIDRVREITVGKKESMRKAA